MYISVTEAQGQLLELVRRAEAGEEVVLTHEGKTVGRLSPVPTASGPKLSPQAVEERLKAIQGVVATFRPLDDGGPDAAHSQDFLYNEDGLPA